MSCVLSLLTLKKRGDADLVAQQTKKLNLV